MNIKMCECGSPMSYYEEKNYQKCGACYQKEKQIEMQKRAEESRRREEERKLQEKIDKERKEAEKKTFIENMLKQCIGKTIEDAKVEEWTDALGMEAKTATLYFSDGTSMDFTQNEIADGCRGCYDYYNYLDIDFNSMLWKHED